MFNSKKINFEPFERMLWLASPTMHGEELQYITEAYTTNWMSTVGENINEIERRISEIICCRYAVALSTGTGALHLAVKLAGERLYGSPNLCEGCLNGKKIFCSDLTFCATVNPVVYEGGEPIFIDSEVDTWNMDPLALERAFEIYPDVKLIIIANLYGTPAKIDEISAIANDHGALIIEDSAESFGATYKGKQLGSFGNYSCISFNGNKIITGSSGGMFLTDNIDDANKVRKLSTQAKENLPWYQHKEIGYNYRMSNLVAGVIRGQVPHLEEHIAQKKRIYKKYENGFRDMPITMNPYDKENSEPNFWLSCILIDKNYMCLQKRSEYEAIYIPKKGKSCPTEILDSLKKYNIEGRPIWKPLSLEPVFKQCSSVTAYGDIGVKHSLAFDIFNRGLCLPSDNKMTEEEQDKVIEIIRACFE